MGASLDIFLPFESLSEGADQQYLADGMTEVLITDLGQASPLRVIARTSVNQYQKTKKPVREIARELTQHSAVARGQGQQDYYESEARVHVNRILLWLLAAAALVTAVALYRSNASKRFNVTPDAQREIEKAMRR